ncbi:MAG: hypothetical protein U1F43_30915 [Myxococcota bacterium]
MRRHEPPPNPARPRPRPDPRACGDDAAGSDVGDASADAGDTSADAPGDAGPDADGDVGPDPTFALLGSVTAELYPADHGFPGMTQFDVSVRDRPYANVHTLAAAAGDCERWVYANPVCDPACGADEACQADHTCLPFAHAVSIGTVTWSNGAATVSSEAHTENPDYLYYESKSEDAGWFAAGDSVHVTATGATLPAFAVTLTGIGPLEAPSDSAPFELASAYTKDVTFVWTPTPGSDATIELNLRTGWHGGPPSAMIVCRAPDAQGHIVVPKAVLAGFGFCTGPCLFQHPSEIQRLSRALVATPNGPLEVVLKARGPLRTSR